jgi:hypothetical protein
MKVKAIYCIYCGKKTDRENGVCCSKCLKERARDTIQRYRKKHLERIKEAKRRCAKKNPQLCVDCGKEICPESIRCRQCSFKNRSRKIKTIDKSGYVLVYRPKHPYANEKGYVREHRLVVEKKIGRFLNKEEVIHHINGKKAENSLKNLMLFSNHKEHMVFHSKIIQFGYTGPVLKQIEERWKNVK